MGTNHHTAWAAGVTAFTAASMGAALLDLDKSITYIKDQILSCDGTISWAAGTLTWDDTIHIYFARGDGVSTHNSIAADSIALSDSEFSYVTLSETNDAVITVSKAALGTGSAAAFKAYNILVLGYRNADNDDFYPKALSGIYAKQASGTGSTYLVGGEQEITCADNVTIDWSQGTGAYMTFDRDAVALTFSNPTGRGVYTLLLKQSAGGSDTITWSTTIKWRGGSEPTLSTDGNAIDILTFLYINSVWYGDISKAFG